MGACRRSEITKAESAMAIATIPKASQRAGVTPAIRVPKATHRAPTESPRRPGQRARRGRPKPSANRGATSKARPGRAPCISQPSASAASRGTPTSAIYVRACALASSATRPTDHESDHRERRHQSPQATVQARHPGRGPGSRQGHHQALAERQHPYREPKWNHIVKIETNDSLGRLDMGGALPGKPRPDGRARGEQRGARGRYRGRSKARHQPGLPSPSSRRGHRADRPCGALDRGAQFTQKSRSSPPSEQSSCGRRGTRSGRTCGGRLQG